MQVIKNKRLVGGLFCVLLGVSIAAGFALGLANKKVPATDTAPAASQQQPKPQAAPQSATPPPASGPKLYVDPDSNAARQAADWRASRPVQAAQMDVLANMPTAKWINSPQAVADAAAYAKAAAKLGATVTMVVYYLPGRDCSGYSAGGAKNGDDYRKFIRDVSSAIGSTQAFIILEPDALAGMDCLNGDQQNDYFSLLGYAIDKLNVQGRKVYLDAGNSNWIKDTSKIADRLRRAGIAKADGFSLNISNFQPTNQTVAYGNAIAKAVGGKHYVVDTSRNGNGAYDNPNQDGLDWCNPPGRALGHYPTLTTGQPLADAYLYVKYPGESDGSDADPNKCFGGPDAGVWWPDYALGLIERWPASLRPH